MKIEQLVRLSSAFSAEVNVLRDYIYKSPKGNQEKIEGYLPNKSSREIFKSIINSCSEATDKKLHLITASYGTGKSYLLLMLANLLGNPNRESLDNFIEKVIDKEEYYNDKLSEKLESHVDNATPFLVVIPEYGDDDFNHAVLHGLKFALQKVGIDYVPKTNYEEAVLLIQHWRENNQANYNALQEKLTGTSIEFFIEQLESYNTSTYADFKKYFQDIVGTVFSETHVSAYPVLADTSKAIRSKGYRGIAIIYDEFGEMLGRLINSSNSSKGIAIQDFLESVKDKKDNSNILFISASHQDPASLRENKEKELNKIIGRFERHQLRVAESEGEEIMGTVFIKERREEFEKVFQYPLFTQHLRYINRLSLYPNKDEDWINNNVLKNLYPLHPLTAYILPRLSAEYAQNTRSMFNFLSPTETKDGALRFYLNSTEVLSNDQLNLFTPDQLLKFFERAIKESKAGVDQAIFEAYTIAASKVNGEELRLMQNLVLLLIIKRSEVKPTKERLFWSMNWDDSRKEEFSFLLHDLESTKEYLEFNHADATYRFPELGSAPLSKIIEEEKGKLKSTHSLSRSLHIWSELAPLKDIFPRDHNSKYGSNRFIQSTFVSDADTIKSHIHNLKAFYNGSKEYTGNGSLFYFISTSEDEIGELKMAVKKDNKLLPYLFYAVPKNLYQFDDLVEKTLYYKAVESTLKRADIIQNASRQKTVQDQFVQIKEALEASIKDLHEPHNWEFYYADENGVDEITSKPKLTTWVDSKIEFLFSQTPRIVDEALWYTKGGIGKSHRSQALHTIFNAGKDRIPLRDDNNNAASSRIIRQFFLYTLITKDTKKEKGIQYGEIKMPEHESSLGGAWKLLDKELGKDSLVQVSDIVNTLLQAPYGLSSNIIEFLLTSYIRYDADRIIIYDSRRRPITPLRSDTIEKLVDKADSFFIRKANIEVAEIKYLLELKSLFVKDQGTNTYADVAQKFVGLGQFLTPLGKSLIKESGNKYLSEFYNSIDNLKQVLSEPGADSNKISKEYLLESLPSIFLEDINNFLDDSEKVKILINKIDEVKKVPNRSEQDFKSGLIRLLSKEVFNEDIVEVGEFNSVVSKWYKLLKEPNKAGKYGDEIINRWLFQIKNPSSTDPLEVYLERLNTKPVKDWEDLSYEKFELINRFRTYKQAIEDYTKSPIEVLQSIARGVFKKTAVECDTESKFDSFFKDWWESLSVIHKELQYSVSTNSLLQNITLASSVKARYLEAIPSLWREQGLLPPHIPVPWEDWSASDMHKIASLYEDCVREVERWRPPVEESKVTEELGYLFGSDKSLKSFEVLLITLTEWFAKLPERTQIANGENIDPLANGFKSSFKDRASLRNFILEKAAAEWQLPMFKNWNEEVLKNLLSNFTALKLRIESYERPLLEIVHALEGRQQKKSESEYLYIGNLYRKIREAEAYKNNASFEDLKDKVSIALLAAEKKGVSFKVLVSQVADVIGLNVNPHLWTTEEDAQFINLFKSGYTTLLAWKVPEEQKLQKAETRIRLEIENLKKEQGLNEEQLMAVLKSIIDKQKVNILS